MLDDPAHTYDGGELDPANFRIGPAFANLGGGDPQAAGPAVAVERRRGGLRQRKGTNSELMYPDGIDGEIASLRPVYVPALDGTGVDALVGASGGFSWAQAGPYRLQTDVPSRAGTDIALVGFVWLLPLKRGAFTRYTVES